MASDYLLEIDGIKGESQDSLGPGLIDVLAFSWGESNSSTSTGAGGGAGKVSMQDFHFVVSASKASPKLMLACASGKHIQRAVLIGLTRGKAGQRETYLKYTLEDVIITSYQTGGSSGGDVVPTDSFSLNFAKITYNYKGVQASWDLRSNTGG